METNKNHRRDFLKKTTGILSMTLIGATATTLIPSCEKSEVIVAPEPDTYEINISDYPALLNVGGMVQMYLTLTDNTEKNLLLIRKSQAEFTVLEAVCRHQNCSVTTPASLNEDIVCNCHGAKFSAEDGKLTDANGISNVPDLIKYIVFDFDPSTNVLKVKV